MDIQHNPGNTINWLTNLAFVQSDTDAPTVAGAQAAIAISEHGVTVLREAGLKQCSTISSSALPAPRSFSAEQMDQMLAKAEDFDMAAVLTVLLATMKNLRQAHREARHANRDAAVEMSLNAANEIRSAAKWAFIGACVSAGVNVVMGATGTILSARQMSKTSAAGSEAQKSTDAVKMAKTEAKVNELQIQLKTEQTKAGANPTSEQAAKIAKIKSELNTEMPKLQEASNQKVTQLENDLSAKNAEIKKIEGQKNSTAKESKLEQATKERAAIEADLKVAKELKTRYNAPESEINVKAAESRLSEIKQTLAEDSPLMEGYAEAQQKFNEVMNKVQFQTSLLQGIQTGAGGISQFTQGLFDRFSSDRKAVEQEYQAAAQKAASEENEAADFQRQANDLIQNILSTMKEYLQAQNQASSSIIRNM